MNDNDKTMVMSVGDTAQPAAESSPSPRLCECGGILVAVPERPGLLRCSKCGTLKQIETFEFSPGITVGKYRLLKRLGAGGMGMVFLCAPLNDSGKRYAMKILRNDFSENIEVSAKRFQRESELLLSLNHPVIIRTYEFWHDDAGFYSLMEYVDGKNLAQLRKEEYLFEEDVALDLMSIVSDAMLYAWDHFRILHRDIKPSNIMISNDNDVKILDFGIARAVNSVQETAMLTLPGQGLGTPGFISPEQFRDAHLQNCASDIYGLGATMYYLFTGKEPFHGKSPGEVYSNMMHSEITPAAELSAVPLSVPMQKLLDNMLEKEPSRRIQGWRKLMLNIEKVKQGQMPLL